MKRLIAIVLLIIICIQANGSLFTLLSFKLNQSFISENLCEKRYESFQGAICAGSCYLNKELKKEQDNHTPLSSKMKVQLDVVYIGTEIHIDLYSNLQDKLLMKSPYKDLSSSLLVIDFFHPPC